MSVLLVSVLLVSVLLVMWLLGMLWMADIGVLCSHGLLVILWQPLWVSLLLFVRMGLPLLVLEQVILPLLTPMDLLLWVMQLLWLVWLVWLVWLLEV